MEKETRISHIEVEERADNAPKFRGYAALFETPTDIGGMFIDGENAPPYFPKLLSDF